MAKKKAPQGEHYEFIRAVRTVEEPEEEGGPSTESVRFEYKLKTADTRGYQTHDEDVSTFSEKDIVKLARSLLSVEPDDPVEVEVGYD